VDRNQLSVQHVENSNWQNVTIVEYVCADGTSINPHVIFKGKTLDDEWACNNPVQARYAWFLLIFIG
jgi:hypothetical protein